MKLLILLLALKGLMPSKKTRKKLAKKRARLRRMKRLAARRAGKPVSAQKRKAPGLFRKIRTAFRAVSFVCIAVPTVLLALKGVEFYRGFRNQKVPAAKR